jgi:uncharacterized protein YozE (UPF0346 family)
VNIFTAFARAIQLFLDGSTPSASSFVLRGKKEKGTGMDSMRVISLAGLTMIIFGVCLSIRRNWNLPRRHAAERLFEAFKEEVQDLSLGTKDAYEILKRAFPKHEKAYTQFRSYLNGKVLQKFDEAWREYSCGGEENSTPPSLDQYIAGGDQTLARERRQLALRRILRFLSSVRMYSHLPPR